MRSKPDDESLELGPAGAQVAQKTAKAKSKRPISEERREQLRQAGGVGGRATSEKKKRSSRNNGRNYAGRPPKYAAAKHWLALNPAVPTSTGEWFLFIEAVAASGLHFTQCSYIIFVVAKQSLSNSPANS